VPFVSPIIYHCFRLSPSHAAQFNGTRRSEGSNGPTSPKAGPSQFLCRWCLTNHTSEASSCTCNTSCKLLRFLVRPQSYIWAGLRRRQLTSLAAIYHSNPNPSLVLTSADFKHTQSLTLNIDPPTFIYHNSQLKSGKTEHFGKVLMAHNWDLPFRWGAWMNMQMTWRKSELDPKTGAHWGLSQSAKAGSVPENGNWGGPW
jgi:hypothetical protein